MEFHRLYLLDANTLITSEGLYYPQFMLPELWDWLLHQAMSNTIKIPSEIYAEILAGKDDRLTKWLKKPEIRQHLVLPDEADPGLLAYVTYAGYAPDLNEVELAQIGRDPFLISYALMAPAERVVVTLENSKPKAQRQNRKVPDVCDSLGAQCCNVFTMLRELEFKTSWNRQVL